MLSDCPNENRSRCDNDKMQFNAAFLRMWEPRSGLFSADTFTLDRVLLSVYSDKRVVAGLLEHTVVIQYRPESPVDHVPWVTASGSLRGSSFALNYCECWSIEQVMNTESGYTIVNGGEADDAVCVDSFRTDSTPNPATTVVPTTVTVDSNADRSVQDTDDDAVRTAVLAVGVVAGLAVFIVVIIVIANRYRTWLRIHLEPKGLLQWDHPIDASEGIGSVGDPSVIDMGDGYSVFASEADMQLHPANGHDPNGIPIFRTLILSQGQELDEDSMSGVSDA